MIFHLVLSIDESKRFVCIYYLFLMLINWQTAIKITSSSVSLEAMFVARFIAAAFSGGCRQIFVAAASCATKPPPPPQPLYGPFTGPPGWAGARRELLDFVVQAKINRGRHTDHLAERHSIRTKQCPPPPSSHWIHHLCATEVRNKTLCVSSGLQRRHILRSACIVCKRLLVENTHTLGCIETWFYTHEHHFTANVTTINDPSHYSQTCMI